MAEVYRQSIGDGSASPTASPAARTPVRMPEEITVGGLASNDAYMNVVREYMTDRLGNKGAQKNEEDNADYVERFLTHMRSFENRSLELAGQIDYMRKADEGQRNKFLNAYTLYNQLPGFMSEGGGSALSAIGDYAYYNVADPVNIAGLGVGSIAAKQLAKQGVKGLMLGMARHGAVPFLTDGAIGAGMDLGLQKVEKETGIRDEYDLGRTGAAFALSGAGSVGAQTLGLGLKKGFDKTVGRDLAEETSEAMLDANADRALARRDGGRTPTQVASDSLNPDPDAVRPSPNSPDVAFNETRGREILDRIGQANGVVSPELRLDINRYVYDFLDGILTDLPNKDLALAIRTPSGKRVKDELVSDTVFRVLQNEQITKSIDEDALSGALAKSGLSAEEFAQIYRMTVRDSARVMNAAMQFSKKLSNAAVLDRSSSNALKAYLTEGIPQTRTQRAIRGVASAVSRPLEAAMTLDRNRRATLVSQIPTLIRNVATTGIRGGIDTAADVLDAAAFFTLRKTQKALGKDVPDYNLAMAVSDALGMARNLVDQDFSKDVVEATLTNNPKLLGQVSRSLTDIGDGSLAAPVRMLNFFNMAHDGLVRRAIYSASLEKQLRRQTGKGVAETLASNGDVPLEMKQKAVREALKFTFADMPTGKFQNTFVKLVEATPFIGTSILTFPRFTISALNFTMDYVLPGNLVKGALNLGKGALGGGAEFTDKGLTQFSKGIVGSAALFTAVAFRAKNQDVKYFEYTDDEGKTGDLRPFFPLQPYLLAADIIVKASNGPSELKKLPPKEILEGILGTRLAGTQLYIIDGLFKSLSSEGDGLTEQKVFETTGNFLGELTGGPVNVNFITGLVRDAARTIDTEEALMRDFRAQEGTSSGERFRDAFTTSFTRGLPFMNRDRPALESPTRSEDMYYQSSLATTFTGIRKSEARNELEKEIVRLGIRYDQINPSTGDAEANRRVTKELGIIGPDMVDLRSSAYEKMTDKQKKNYIIDMYAQARAIAKDIAKGKSYKDEITIEDDKGKKRRFTPFDRTEWGSVPSRIRDEVNEYFKENFGGSVEDLGAYRAGNDYAKTVRGRYR